MLAKVLSQAAELLGKEAGRSDIGEPEFGDPRYVSVPFSTHNFHEVKGGKPSCGAGFVDGGNQEVLSAPDLSVQMVRVCPVLFRGGQRARLSSLPAKVEFLCLARTHLRDGEIFYGAELFPLQPGSARFLPDPALLQVSSRDDRLSSGRFRLNISVVGAAARRFAEWAVLRGLVEEELEMGDIAVRDGTLQTAVSREAESASAVFSAAERTGVVLTALAKTSRLCPSPGGARRAAGRRLRARGGGSEGCWYYHPLVRNAHPEHRAEIFACRLHPRARHVFRFEILREQAASFPEGELDRVFCELRAHSGDLTFPGYPYGLLDADRRSHVARREAEMLGALLSSALAERGAWEPFQRHASAADAHDLLDEI